MTARSPAVTSTVTPTTRKGRAQHQRHRGRPEPRGPGVQHERVQVGERLLGREGREQRHGQQGGQPSHHGPL